MNSGAVSLRDDVATGMINLRRIKTKIIGHEGQKREYLVDGLLPTLSELLLQSNGEDEIAEAAAIITILSNEGPRYVEPILKSEVLSILVQQIPHSSPRESLTILKSLKAVADNLPPKEPGSWAQDTQLAELVCNSESIDHIISFVNNYNNSSVSQHLCDQSIALLCQICTTETQKRFLVEKGLLQSLACRLASFVVCEGLVVPTLEVLDFPSSVSSSLPTAAPPCAHLSPVLEGIVLLIEQSKDRAEALLSDPTMALVLPPTPNGPSAEIRPAWASTHLSTRLPRARPRNAFDGLLPVVPVKEKSHSASNFNFPPLGAANPGPRRRTSFHPQLAQAANINLDQEVRRREEEGTLIPYLIYIARQFRGKRRLLASRLLAVFLKFDLVSPTRAKSFPTLLVPIVVGMLDQYDSGPEQISTTTDVYLCNGLHYSKAAPAVLALLVMDEPEMQKVAVEAKAISKLAKGLKQTFETTFGQKPISWRPQKVKPSEEQSSTPDCIIGVCGPSRTMRLDMAHREGTLQAFAAIAPFNDDYRKQICDQGILTQIILSLEPFHVGQVSSETMSAESRGNSASTILAACGAVRALTRSVIALRTKLVDAEVAKAIIKLMNVADPEVRIAATKVLINLAMDFSPMKDSVSETAVVKKLCEQAHSANASLRLESIWALKQLVVNASKKLKQEVVNELGSSWIKLLIQTDPYDIPAGEVIGLVDKEYPTGNILDEMTAVTTKPEDVVMSEDSDEEQSIHFARARSEPGQDEFNKHTPEDDLAIQEQLLDLIRNLFCGDNASDLVDYLLGEMNRDDFFKILLTRIRPKTLMGATRKDNQVSPAPTQIVVKVLYILVHIAACSHKWRTVVANEQAILKQVSLFSSHAEQEVRAQFCWLAINLLFEDETSDRNACRRRALELQRIGYAGNMRRLENDPMSDVRERAKTAIHLFSSLLESR